MSAGEGRPQFVVTVDVEDFFEPRPPIDTYRGRIGGRDHATPRIMDIVERHGGRGTFFVDVQNRRTVSEELVAGVTCEIAERGHEVGLHTHPAFPEGRRGYGMAQTMKALDREAQTEFVRQGAELIETWTGRRPVSHRAGGYGANYDTLAALEANGITIDSSVFSGYPYCGLNEPPLTVNAPVRRGRVLEIPVTVTGCELALGSFSRAPRLFSMVKKLDPDWCSPGELRRQIEAVLADGERIVVLFLHSYSLIDIERGFRPDERACATLEALLSDCVGRYGGELVTLEQAAQRARVLSAEEALAKPPPLVRSDLLLRHLELTGWLLRKVKPRHLQKLFASR
ncbi:polysaccharide deacetylase family protein [Bosea sp. FBZP-16]|uniref:polysaccharide deacetylase family protein n=1 Tax=Bosea sp. FBZP-16 TaxID=2065382 RepID=UPI000C3008DC|nr:polysaccharide deacetylase family protein [Bosea sp. FBZP-16]